MAHGDMEWIQLMNIEFYTTRYRDLFMIIEDKHYRHDNFKN